MANNALEKENGERNIGLNRAVQDY